jgi:hypothetical protein
MIGGCVGHHPAGEECLTFITRVAIKFAVAIDTACDTGWTRRGRRKSHGGSAGTRANNQQYEHEMKAVA